MAEAREQINQDQQDADLDGLPPRPRQQDVSSQHHHHKSIIAKDKFIDEHFDLLVRETSKKILQDGQPVDDDDDDGDDHLQQSPATAEKLKSCQMTPEGGLEATTSREKALSQPKRPMNAFMVWGQAIRRELHNKFSNVQNAMLSKALGRVWRTLDAKDKEPFLRRANKIKANHKLAYPNYRYQPRRIQQRRIKSNLLLGLAHLNYHQTSHSSMKSSSSITSINRIGTGLGGSSSQKLIADNITVVGRSTNDTTTTTSFTMAPVQAATSQSAQYGYIAPDNQRQLRQQQTRATIGDYIGQRVYEGYDICAHPMNEQSSTLSDQPSRVIHHRPQNITMTTTTATASQPPPTTHRHHHHFTQLDNTSNYWPTPVAANSNHHQHYQHIQNHPHPHQQHQPPRLVTHNNNYQDHALCKAVVPSNVEVEYEFDSYTSTYHHHHHHQQQQQQQQCTPVRYDPLAINNNLAD